MEQKLKQRICIEFCVKLQISATDTFEMLNKAFPNNAPKRTTVFEWHSRFKAGRISIEDDPRQGRPTFQRTDENVQKITDLIKENPRTTLLELEQDTGISKTTIGRIVTEHLRLKKTPAKFIPRFLTNEQKLCWLATCEDMLEMTRTDPEWKDKIITGDETWVYGYDPETKRQSAEWRGQAKQKDRRKNVYLPHYDHVKAIRLFACQSEEMRLAPGFHRRVKAKTSLQADDVPIDDMTTKQLYTPGSTLLTDRDGATACYYRTELVSRISLVTKSKKSLARRLVSRKTRDYITQDKAVLLYWLPYGQGTSVGRYCDQGAWIDLICSPLYGRHQSRRGHPYEQGTFVGRSMEKFKVHQPKGPATKVFLTKQLILLKMNPNERLQDYLNKFSSLADRLSEMDAQVPEDFLSILLLCSLPESYEGFRTAIETRDELPSFETLKVKMLEEEIRQTQLNGTTNTEQAFLGNPERKNFPSTSKPKPKGFPFSCHFCGKKGHKAADCRKRKSRNPKNEMVASFGTKYLSKLGANEWCLDSGATAHMCSSRDSFDHFEETAPVKITLANGGFIEALGKGSVKLECSGSKSFAVNNRPNRSKFAPRSEEYKLIGYFTESKAYRLWKPGTRTIIKSRDVRFIEPELSRIRNEVIEIDVSPQKDPFVKEIPLVEEKGSTSEAKSQTEIESESDLEMSDLVDEPSESEVIISRRGRGRPRYIRTGKPGRPRKEYPTANLSTQELLAAKYLPDPKDAEEALSGRDSYFWKKAMEEEFDSLIENKTWELVDPPKNRNIIGTKWVFKTKCNSDGFVERHKARLVAKGYSQQYGIDYEETFAPVVRQSTIRMFLALAVEYNLILHQMDVQSAYLNGEIKEEIYMTQPENFVSRKYPEKVCRLKKAIYGLKQAGIVWHEKLDNELKNLGLKQLQSDNCVYIKHDEGILLVAIYVDDLIIAAEREATLKSFKESMKRIFKIKDLGGINCCLGIRIQMKEDGSISIDQERYIEELLAKYRMKEAKPISTPMDSNSKLTKISSIEGENEPVKKVEYQSLIGSLIYLSVSTRPDIAYAVSALGQFSNDPRRQHWNAARRVLRYLKGTSCLRITYRKSNEALHGYADADWGGNLVDRKSHTGIVYFLARGPIAWESKKQQTVTLSSTESEYIALCEAGKEAVYLRALLDEMGFGELLNGPTVLKTDNQGAQQLARNPVYHARTKHIDIKWHYIRSICSDGLVEVVHTPTQENVADILTKGLPRFLYEKHVTGFGM
ncbi:hypothetical protein LAZ67_6001370 [Cordylochernes scorpioides]|uniref:CCHC-type domain-containing protein n=1 Tax=Cordylochernes scorpioides TaxID=51811 RepID=A0ABY6KM43_9ARAC|nr:hypothetical protein LAZ67_6001370 [Cordylochernes scorpioides]